jgi:hypothetical protein
MVCPNARKDLLSLNEIGKMVFKENCWRGYMLIVKR